MRREKNAAPAGGHSLINKAIEIEEDPAVARKIEPITRAGDSAASQVQPIPDGRETGFDLAIGGIRRSCVAGYRLGSSLRLRPIGRYGYRG